MESAEMNVLLLDPKFTDRSWRSASFHVFDKPHMNIARRAKNVFVIVDANGLPEVSRFVSLVNRRNQLRALAVRFDGQARWLPPMLERAKLRNLRNTLVHSGGDTLSRILNAWRIGAQHELIADARAFDDTLMVISCEPTTYEVSFDKLPALGRIARSKRTAFEVAEDGSHLHWPADDIHLDLDAIRFALDPGYRRRTKRSKALHDRAYGKSITEVRKNQELRQTDIPGLSERQVRRIEGSGEVTTTALSALARAHGMKLGEYLDAIAARVAPSPDMKAIRKALLHDDQNG